MISLPPFSIFVVLSSSFLHFRGFRIAKNKLWVTNWKETAKIIEGSNLSELDIDFWGKCTKWSKSVHLLFLLLKFSAFFSNFVETSICAFCTFSKSQILRFSAFYCIHYEFFYITLLNYSYTVNLVYLVPWLFHAICTKHNRLFRAIYMKHNRLFRSINTKQTNRVRVNCTK